MLEQKFGHKHKVEERTFDESGAIRKELRESNSDLWKRIREMDKEHSERIAQMEKSHSDRITALQTQVDDWRSKYYQLMEKWLQLETEHKVLKEEYEEAKLLAETMRTELNALRGK